MIQDTTGIALHLTLYGRRFKVNAVADNAEEANAYMLANEGQSVLAVTGSLVVMAHKDDEGKPL